ncbi:MAG: ABC transporter ATP-binding protein, partial [Clostridiales bacterium]|nr:ABC transporter ATP-binding protein [Clostridiales bacterium]
MSATQNNAASASVRRRRGPLGGPMGGGPMGMMGGGPKAKDFKGSLKKLLTYLAPFKKQIILVLILAALSTVFLIAGPKILAEAIDELIKGLMRVITGASGGIDFGYISRIILTLIGLYLLSAGFSYLQGYTMAGVSTKVAYNLRNSISQKINRMPLDYFHRTSHGEVLSRITNDVDTLNHSLNQSITQLITSVTTIVGVLIMMLTISRKLTLITLCILPVSLLLLMFVIKKSQKYFIGQQKYLGAVNGHVEEMYGGHFVMKAFNGEKKSLEAFDKENE